MSAPTLSPTAATTPNSSFAPAESPVPSSSAVIDNVLSRAPSTISPTSGLSPSASPTTSSPTVSPRPTLSLYPTVSPVPPPTYSPVVSPSAHPSSSDVYSTEDRFFQDLEVTEERIFDEVETGIYQILMESYTEVIGTNQTLPFVITKCNVVDQKVGFLRGRYLKGDRNTQSTTGLVLSVIFTMNYTSHYGVNVEESGWNYPVLFTNHLNENTTAIAEGMQEVFLPVVSVGETIRSLFPASPTNSPTTITNTSMPSSLPSLAPTSLPSLHPSFSPSSAPDPPIATKSNVLALTLGIMFGVLGAAGLTYLFLWRHNIMKRKKSQGTNMNLHSPEETNAEANDDIRDSSATPWAAIEADHATNVEGDENEIITSEIGVNLTMPGPQTSARKVDKNNDFEPSSTATSLGFNTIDSMITLGSEFFTPSPGDQSSPLSPSYKSKLSVDEVFTGTNLMVAREDSSSSHDSDDDLATYQNQNRGNGDAFDDYRNESLDKLRCEVEASIAEVEGMMSLATTRILIDADESELDLSWVGAEDLGSIEASSFCETYEWTKRNESDTA